MKWNNTKEKNNTLSFLAQSEVATFPCDQETLATSFMQKVSLSKAEKVELPTF